ncbi:MAG TPA: hypothetical protein VIN06_19155 [Devosia sp.]
MRLSLTLAAPFLVLLASGGAQAAASPEQINSVLASCPADAAAGTCTSAVSSFANGLTDADRDSDLLNLANSLAAQASGSQVDPDACVEIKAGIDAAADAASTSAQGQITAVGDPLCGDLDASATGSVAPAESFAAPQSLVDSANDL